MASLYRKLVDILEENDCWKVTEGAGSHEIWCCPNSKRPFPIKKDFDDKNFVNNEILKKQARVTDRIP